MRRSLDAVGDLQKTVQDRGFAGKKDAGRTGCRNSGFLSALFLLCADDDGRDTSYLSVFVYLLSDGPVYREEEYAQCSVIGIGTGLLIFRAYAYRWCGDRGGDGTFAVWAEKCLRPQVFDRGGCCSDSRDVLWPVDQRNVMNTVYAVTDAEQLAVNDYAGQISNLKSMLTFKGISRLFFSGTGKFYYLVMASFGLLCPAFCICLKKTLQVLRRLSSLTEDFVDGDGNGCFYLFCLLSLLGQCMVTAIAAMNPGRLDGIFYGRYNEYLLPVLIGIGLMAICDARRKSCVYFASVGVSLILFGITFWDALHSGLTAMQGYFAPGISYFSDDWHYVVRPELWKAFLVGIFLMTVVTVCIGMAGRSGKYTGILAVLLLMESGLAFCLGEKYIRHFNDMNYYNLKIYQYMEDSEAPVSYLYGGGFSGIDLLQFALQDRKIEVIRAEELDLNGSEEGNNLPQEGFLIVDQGCGQLAEIEQNYTKCAESRAFVLFRIKETDEKDG